MAARFADHAVFGDIALALAPRSLDAARAAPSGGSDQTCVQAREALFDAAVRGIALAAQPDRSRSRAGAAGDARAFVFRVDELSRAAAASPAALVLLRAHENARRRADPPRIMGVINATPDSFSDGGRFIDPDRALERGLALVREGADVIDIGGESTRPGARPVQADEELRRVIPVVRELARSTRTPLSIDTTKADVAEAAIEAGASIVNDVSAGRVDPRMLPMVASRRVGFVAMHSQGAPRHMQESPTYADVVSEVLEHLRGRVRAALEAGIEPSRVWIDPGIGFGKTLEHNLELLSALADLRSLGLPVCVGVSRKSFISAVEARVARPPAGADPEHRTGGTAAAIAIAVWHGAEILRVHDVRTMAQAARVAWACRAPRMPSVSGTDESCRRSANAGERDAGPTRANPSTTNESNRTTARSCPASDEEHNHR
jgi:dihydropteroate synthase